MKPLLMAGLLTLTISSSYASNSDNLEWRSWDTVGAAQLSMLFFDIYESELLTPNGQYTISNDITPHPLALSITYQRDISQQQLLDATVEQWQKLGFPSNEMNEWSKKLEIIFPDIEEGHNITYVTNGSQGDFFHSGSSSSAQLIGSIQDESFNDAFLSIWLSPDTEYPKLRQGLLGNNQ